MNELYGDQCFIKNCEEHPDDQKACQLATKLGFNKPTSKIDIQKLMNNSLRNLIIKRSQTQ